MAKYKVLDVFKDKNTNVIYIKNEEIELSAKRFEEIEVTLGKNFLKRVEVAEKVMTKKDVKVKKAK